MRKAVAKFTVTKVLSQPTNQDIILLDNELTAIASSFPTSLGGGLHGHTGLVTSVANYKLMATGTPFIVPANPGVYPAGNIPAAQFEQWEAEHKELIQQFQMCVGASKGLKDLIIQAINKDFLLELCMPGIAYLNMTPLQMLTHLCNQWGAMDYVDINVLMAKCDTTWDTTEVPTKHFNWIEKAWRQLTHANIQIDQRAMMVKALKSFKDAGDFDAAIQAWEARPVVLQMYKNLKVVMCAKYSKLNPQDTVSARATRHASANTVEEFAQAMEELITELTEQHAKQIEALIKANSKTMAKLTAAVNENKTPAAATPVAAIRPPTAVQSTKTQRRAKKCRNATTCPHCSRIHPNRTHDQCWHLKKNASKRLAR